MRCPMLPIGPGVDRILPVNQTLVQRIQQNLYRRGYRDVPQDGTYGPATARALHQFQQDNPTRTASDLAVSVGVRGPNGQPLGVAGCQTYQALGIDCEGADCVISVWQPLLGNNYATTALLCAALHAAVDTDCAAGVPQVPPITPTQPTQASELGIWPIVALGALLVLVSRRR